MDDTNPTKEDVEFVDAIKEDIHWLGFDWGDRFFYGIAITLKRTMSTPCELIKKGLAYVCELTPERVRRSTAATSAQPAVSPYRDRADGGEPGPL